MLHGQIWILVHHANDIKLDFDAADFVPFVCCDVLFDDFGGVSGVDVGEEVWFVDGLVCIDWMSICSGLAVGWRELTLGLSSGIAILC
jgi:hypothetical protein